MSTPGLEQFRRLLTTDQKSSEQLASDEIFEPLRDLLTALLESGVGGELVMGSLGRVSLVLWPQHRPSHSSLVLEMIRLPGEVAVLLPSGRRTLTSSDELKAFLVDLVSKPEFRAMLSHLHERAQKPELAVLRSDTDKVLVEIDPEAQRRLGEVPVGKELDLQLTLDDGEFVPSDFQPKSFVSAGLRFVVLPRTFSLVGRTLSVSVRKAALSAIPNSAG